MRKLLVSVAGLLALSVLLGACDAQLTPYAARVGSSTVSTTAVDDAMRAISSDTGYRCELLSGASSTGSAIAIEGKGGSSFASSFAADVLTQLVQYDAAHQAVARLKLSEGAFVRQLAASQLPAALTPSSTSGCSETGAQILAGFSAPYRKLLAQFEIDQLALLGHLAGVTLTRSGIAQYETTHKAASTLACTSVIEVASKTAAVAASKQISAGTSFATVAKTESTDPSGSSGGALGCVFPSAFTAPLNSVVASLPIGQVSAPVPFGTSYLLLTVTSRPLASLSEVASQVLLGQQTNFSTLLAKATAASDVTVDPTYGSWRHSTTGWSVAAPTGPADALLPDPTGVTPVASASSVAAAG